MSGEDYAAIVELSTRQAMATFELTVGEEESEVFGFLKEISSNGDMSTVDVIFPLCECCSFWSKELPLTPPLRANRSDFGLLES